MTQRLDGNLTCAGKFSDTQHTIHSFEFAIRIVILSVKPDLRAESSIFEKIFNYFLTKLI